jgi:hypothetical protein
VRYLALPASTPRGQQGEQVRQEAAQDQHGVPKRERRSMLAATSLAVAGLAPGICLVAFHRLTIGQRAGE